MRRRQHLVCGPVGRLASPVPSQALLPAEQAADGKQGRVAGVCAGSLRLLSVGANQSAWSVDRSIRWSAT
jgi:hypothetical protein